MKSRLIAYTIYVTIGASCAGQMYADGASLLRSVVAVVAWPVEFGRGIGTAAVPVPDAHVDHAKILEIREALSEPAEEHPF